MEFISLFFPSGMESLSRQSQENLKDCSEAWAKGEAKDRLEYPGDEAIRKRNWENAGHQFKSYFIRWLVISILLIVGGLSWYPTIESLATTAEILVYLALTFCAISVTGLNGVGAMKFWQFKKHGKEVWKQRKNSLNRTFHNIQFC